MQRVAERERLGGIYSSLTPETPNGVLEEILEELRLLLLMMSNSRRALLV